jgi:hypothetical protein
MQTMPFPQHYASFQLFAVCKQEHKVLAVLKHEPKVFAALKQEHTVLAVLKQEPKAFAVLKQESQAFASQSRMRPRTSTANPRQLGERGAWVCAGGARVWSEKVTLQPIHHRAVTLRSR